MIQIETEVFGGLCFMAGILVGVVIGYINGKEWESMQRDIEDIKSKEG